MKTENTIYIVVIIVAVLIIGVLYFTFYKGSNTNSENPQNSPIETIYVNGQNFKFIIDGNENPDIVVKQGDKVKIVFTSIGGFHDFVVDELNAKTSQVNEGQSSTIEFVADKKGIFEYYCSVGSHRQMGMKGKFIVE